MRKGEDEVVQQKAKNLVHIGAPLDIKLFNFMMPTPMTLSEIIQENIEVLPTILRRPECTSTLKKLIPTINEAADQRKQVIKSVLLEANKLYPDLLNIVFEYDGQMSRLKLPEKRAKLKV